MPRTALQKFVGSTETKTDVSSLNLPEIIGKSSPVEGVVPRVIVGKHLLPIKVIPKIDSTPFYVKLRAEADDDLMETGSGKMYLGFHLDPLKHVHWNNLAAPVKYELRESGVTTFTPAIGIGPQIEQPSDIDPREFLVVVKNWNTEKPIELTLKYFACDEDDKWCIPVTQFYDIHLERDPLAGRGYDRSMR